MDHRRRCSLGWLAALAVGFGSLLATPTAMAKAPAPQAGADQAAATPEPAATEPAAAAAPEPAAAEPAPPAVLPPGPPESLIADGEVPKGPIAPAFPPAIPSIDYGARMRMVLKVFNPYPASANKLNDIGEQVDADIYTSGQIHRYFKWVASVTLSYPGTAGASSTATVQPLDVFAHFALMPEFNVMLGRMIVVADRFAPGGPWAMDEFFYAGFFPVIAAPALPKSGPSARDVGMTIWGAPLGGRAKYYLGMFNLNDPGTHPLFSGRVQANLVGVEPAFNHRSTYYGSKDLISIGLGWQYQADGSVQPVPVTTPPTAPLTDGYKYFTADVTVEKNIPDVGTVSGIGAFSKYWGEYQPWKHSWLLSAGYMLPQVIGIGKPRMTLRYQGGKSPAPGASTSYVIDAQASYPIHAWFARLALGYRHGDSWLGTASQSSNMLYLAVQLWDP
jgi:hypothetical protein